MKPMRLRMIRLLPSCGGLLPAVAWQLSLALVLLALPAVGWSQIALPPPGHQPGKLPLASRGSSPATASSGVPAVSPPDTVLGLLTGPASWPAPVAITLQSDTVRFGDVAVVLIDFPAAADEVTADSVSSLVDWLVWAEGGTVEQGGGLAGRFGRWLSRLGRKEADRVAAAAEIVGAGRLRITRQARVFHPGPFRLGWAGQPGTRSDVGVVLSRLAGAQEPHPVRSPRSLGWHSYLLASLALVLALLCWLIWWMRQRRGAVTGLAHLRVPAPAYLHAAQELWNLHESRLLARGEGRTFLDRLSGIVRRYVAARYRLGAQEKTADEIAATMLEQGHDRQAAAAFASLLRVCDDRRYGPDDVALPFCREQFAGCCRLLAHVRVEARFSPVPAQLAVDGGRCWARLRQAMAEPVFSSEALVGEVGGD